MDKSDLLVPVRSYRTRDGKFTMPRRAVLASVSTADELPFDQLADDLRGLGLGAPKRCYDAVSPAAVRVHRDHTFEGDETYKLTVGADGVEIVARSDAGAYYGIQTLRDLLNVQGPKLECCLIQDSPDYARRGVYHDCSRGKVPTVETLKQLIERLAHWKINELQLYVENVFRFVQHPAIGRRYSPFTAEDMLELQDFAELHHVRLVGSLASFGHMEKILQLPQYRELAELPGHRGWPGGTTLNPLDPNSIKLVSDLYEEFLPLHKAVDFNVCCDETWELGKGKSKKVADKKGVGTVYTDFLLKIYDLCQKHGKRMNAWNDIVLKYPEQLKRLPKDIVALNWWYNPTGGRIERTHETIEAGLPTIVCPGTSCWQSNGCRLHNGMENISRFAKVGRKYDCEGLLNTDWGDGGHRNFLGISLVNLASGAAHAWYGTGVNDKDFVERFARQAMGQKNDRLAKSIRLLGGMRPKGPDMSRYSWNFYHAIGEPLLPKGEGKRMDPVEPDDAKAIIKTLSDPELWPSARKLPRFEQLAIQEMAVAAQMECLSAERSILAKRLRAGEHVSAEELRDHAIHVRRVARAFERQWMERNRPSRLKDNMKLYKKAEDEARKLAKKA